MPKVLNSRPFPCLLITGASSGIGAELAKSFSTQGVTLLLGGRDSGRLERVAAECEARGAKVIHWLADLCDLKAAIETLARLDDAHPISLAIFNAGIGDSGTTGGILESYDATARLADINFRVPAALASLLAERMVARKAGAICLVGSTAAWAPLPMAPAYTGSKAGIQMFARALDAAARPSNVYVTLATPGFIDTPMSRRLDCAKPFLMSAERAAKIMTKAILARKREVIFPWQFWVLRLVLKLVPDPLVRLYLARARYGTRPYDPDK